MRRFLVAATMVGLLGLLAAMAGCAAGNFDPTKMPGPEKVGYHINLDESTVLFYFQPRFAEEVTENGTDQRMAWDGAVESVYIAGEFNGWDRYGWPMTHDATTGVYTLTKTFEEAGGAGDHLFKYVINGEYWVEPPVFALNKTDAGIANESMNWTLIVPETESKM